MIEALLFIITVSTLLNSILIIKMFNRKCSDLPLDDKIYEERIKNYKKIIRLNERYIRDLKQKVEEPDTNIYEPKFERRY